MNRATRLESVQPSLTLAISARAAALKAQGVDVIGFGVGEPDFNTPQSIIDAAKSALDAGMTKYTPVAGMPALRKEIAAWYGREFGIEVTSDNVIVGVGGKQGIYNAIMATINAGDRVLIPSPYWLTYPAQVLLAGGEPIFLETLEAHDFLLTPQALEEAICQHRPKMLILNSPSNPTGQAYSAQQLSDLAEVLRAHQDVCIIWDNIYAHLTYEGFEHIELGSVAPDLRDRIIVTGGFSKTFAMTGWRLGFTIADASFIKAMSTIQGHSTSNATSFAQCGAIEALKLDHGFIDEMRKTFTRRRACILAEIDKIEGVTCRPPKGAFYVMMNCTKFMGSKFESNIIQTDVDLAEFLINNAFVATIPGSAFGAPGYLRLSFAIGTSTIIEGISRISRALDKLRG